MLFKEIKYNSKEYFNTLDLRSAILRAPLGKELSSEDTLDEENQIHFACFDHHRLAACVVAKPIKNDTCVKLRQMAVDSSYQGKGIGRHILIGAEEALKKKGFKQIELSARKVAQGFYEKLAYEVVGSYYLEQGIEHIKMHKNFEQQQA
jgi:predicted GNAT family N-acyltransferase